MKKKKIATIVGARPQFIKMAALSPHLRKKFKEVIVHTGQHYDYEMSKVFFNELAIPRPDINLNIGSGKHGEQTARMLIAIEEALIREKPSMAVVFGDTNSTLAGALAAAKLNIPVAHVEAGLRSYDRSMPEEVNRLAVDHISDFLFCPTQTAVKNLSKEGVKEGVFLVGDIMKDSLRNFLSHSRKKMSLLSRLKIKPKEYYLLTIHRAGNTANRERLKKMLASIDSLDSTVIFPIHPGTRKFLADSFKPKNMLHFIPPVTYLEMLCLENNAKAVLTDSGGVQKEAYILKVPCVTLRKNTEWVETLSGGCNTVINPDGDDLFSLCRKISKRRNSMKFNSQEYGDGNTAGKITEILFKKL